MWISIMVCIVLWFAIVYIVTATAKTMEECADAVVFTSLIAAASIVVNLIQAGYLPGFK